MRAHIHMHAHIHSRDAHARTHTLHMHAHTLKMHAHTPGLHLVDEGDQIGAVLTHHWLRAVAGPPRLDPLLGSNGSSARSSVDPSIGDPSIGDPSIGDPSIGDPSIGDPSIGDPSIGDPSIAGRALLPLYATVCPPDADSRGTAEAGERVGDTKQNSSAVVGCAQAVVPTPMRPGESVAGSQPDQIPYAAAESHCWNGSIYPTSATRALCVKRNLPMYVHWSTVRHGATLLSRASSYMPPHVLLTYTSTTPVHLDATVP
jgi:hypothetical protein